MSRMEKMWNGWVRPQLPSRGYPTVRGIEVRSEYHSEKPFDFRVPWEVPSEWVHPRCKGESLSGLDKTVEKGDKVVVIGGGLGLTTVHAVRAGASEVTVFEPVPNRWRIVEETARTAGVWDRVRLRKESVGELGAGTEPSGARISVIGADELPNCDVLEMDCEGAERWILNNLLIRPRGMVVETHPSMGSPEDDVEGLLAELGYGISARYPTEYDGPVLVAVKEG